MGFSQALSGLNAAATNLDVIGNNVANAQTVGFKGSSAQFADVYASSDVGLGTRVADVAQDFSSGTLEGTGRGMDLAIDGEGFFRMRQNNEVVFSRNGQFSTDADGYITNAQGARVTGYPSGVSSGGDPVELQVPNGALAARPTSHVEMDLNLDASEAPVPAGASFDPSDSGTYSYANNVTLYDSQGGAHNATMYFSKAAHNAWSVRAEIDGNIRNLGNIEFNANGLRDTSGNLGPVTFPSGGGPNDIEITVNLDNATQFADGFDVKSVSQDGYASGSLVGVDVNEQGQVVGNYSNEQSQVLGTIAVAQFSNPEGLNPIGDNAWQETTASGQAVLGMPGSGQLGALQSETVETSNVDLTQELVDMIIAQRNYQANSQTITVQDEVMQTVVNMR